MLNKASSLDMNLLIIEDSLMEKQNKQKQNNVPNKEYISSQKPPGKKLKSKIKNKIPPKVKKKTEAKHRHSKMTTRKILDTPTDTK